MNYIIRLDDGRVFGGWDFEGKILILPENRKELAYRMQRTLAMRTIEKIENFTDHECEILKIAA